MKDRNNIGTLIVATNSYLTYLILINKYMPTVERKWPVLGASRFLRLKAGMKNI